MALNLPKPIQEFIDDTPISKIGGWFRLLITFYIKPVKFFKIYYSQRIEDQIKQLSLYCFLFVVIFYFFPGFEIKDCVRLLISMSPIVILFSILLYITAVILKVKHNIAILSISFVFITFLLWLIPAIFFYLFFIENEDYTYLLLSNLILTYLIFLVYIIFWIVIGVKTIKVITAWILSLLLLNSFFFFLSYITVGQSAKGINPDPIVAEVEYYLPNIFMTKGQPYSRITTLENGERLMDTISLTSNDTITYIGGSNYTSYRKMVKKDIKEIDSIMKKLQFKRSKEIFESLGDYYSTLDSDFDSDPNNSHLKSTVYCIENSNKVLKVSKEYIVDSTCKNHYKDYLSRSDKLKVDNNSAYVSDNINALLLFPYYYIGRIFKLETYHVNTYF